MTATQTTRVTAEPGLPFVDVVREFNAPAARVYRAHTDPELFAQWIGPRRYSTTVERYDARSGGSYRFVQTGDDGARYAFHGSFHEMTEPNRMVQTFEFEGDPGHVSLDTAELEDLPDGRCRLTVHSTFQSVQDRDAMLAAGMTDGMNEGYERLDGLLASGGA
ncbi:ATPase [Sinomonas cellulolyticus]|uniref:SRPBCC family protein n=1 Tax=Sinomonas cellulolyticus TaxID=2801916 RepID=A0ABS1K6Z1_9MICC|nr:MULTISPECIES: SRPBCC family protein [Sinomonas]MBL0707077.1 SRPBCC family protein [Sinomonas cellulolyticus]GHG54547.1 ATPase [Sinomonas sp. KCTC 49339]